MIPWICSKKHKEYISEAAGPHSIAFKPTLRWHRGQVIRRSRRWASALKFGSAGSPRVACPTSVPERLELYGEARPKPPTLRRRAQKSFRKVGESFLAGIRVAHKRLQEHNPSPPILRVPRIGEKTPFWHIFRTIFSFSKWTKCCKLQHFCVLPSFAGAMQKRRKCCKYQYFFWTRDAQNTANTSVFESQAKKHCKLQHFWRVDRKKWWYSQCFCNFKKTWEARNTVNSGVLATFGRRNAGIYAVFCPWRRQTPVNYNIFFPFWSNFLHWWTQKTLVFARFSKNRRSWRERNHENNSVLATFGD